MIFFQHMFMAYIYTHTITHPSTSSCPKIIYKMFQMFSWVIP